MLCRWPNACTGEIVGGPIVIVTLPARKTNQATACRLIAHPGNRGGRTWWRSGRAGPMDNSAHNDNSNRRDHDRLTLDLGIRAVLDIGTGPQSAGCRLGGLRMPSLGIFCLVSASRPRRKTATDRLGVPSRWPDHRRAIARLPSGEAAPGGCSICKRLGSAAPQARPSEQTAPQRGLARERGHGWRNTRGDGPSRVPKCTPQNARLSSGV